MRHLLITALLLLALAPCRAKDTWETPADTTEVRTAPKTPDAAEKPVVADEQTMAAEKSVAAGQTMADEKSVAAGQTMAAEKSVAAGQVMADAPLIAPIDSAAFMMSEDSMLVLTDAVTDSVLRQLPAPKEKERFVPDSHRALWLGLVFPGAGQIYNRKYWKLPIIYGGFLGCLYALNWNAQMYNDYRQAYLDIMDNDPNTHSYLDMLPIGYDITGKEDRFKEIFRRKKDYYRKYRDLSIFAMVGVWALSVIDAFVDAELSTFDISPNLSMRFSPSLFNSSDLAGNREVINTGVRISLRVK